MFSPSIVSEFLPKVKFLSTKLDTVARAAQRRELPYEFYAAAYGTAWAMETGRVGGAISAKLEGMTRPQLAKYLARVASECATINDVPAWINRNVAA